MGAPLIEPRGMPRQPGRDYEEVPLVTDGSMDLNFRDGETYSQAPSLAVAYPAYTDKKIHVLTNIGQQTPAGMGPWRTVFVKDNLMQAFRPGKPLPQWTELDDCKPFAEYLWNACGPFHIISGEAQESNSDWRFQTDYAPNQCVWINKYLTQLRDQHAGVINTGPAYAGYSNWWPSKSSMSEVIDALTTAAKLKAFMSAREWEFARYMGLDMHLTGVLPMCNVYMTQNDAWEQYWQSRLRITLMQRMLTFLGLNPLDMGGFGWWRCSAGIDPFTEIFQMDYGNNLTAYTADFNIHNPNVQYATATLVLNTIRHLMGWENPYAFGTNKNTIASPYDNARYNLQGSTAGRNMVNRYNPASGAVSGDYPYPNIPYGHNDIGAIAAKHTCLARDIINKRPGPVGWRRPGQSAYKTVNENYYVTSCYNHEPDINMASDNNNTPGGKRIVTIYDPENSGTAQIDLGGGAVAEITYPAGTYRQYKVTLT